MTENQNPRIFRLEWPPLTNQASNDASQSLNQFNWTCRTEFFVNVRVDHPCACHSNNWMMCGIVLFCQVKHIWSWLKLQFSHKEAFVFRQHANENTCNTSLLKLHTHCKVFFEQFESRGGCFHWHLSSHASCSHCQRSNLLIPCVLQFCHQCLFQLNASRVTVVSSRCDCEWWSWHGFSCKHLIRQS